jgi:hypothetical protein
MTSNSRAHTNSRFAVIDHSFTYPVQRFHTYFFLSFRTIRRNQLRILWATQPQHRRAPPQANRSKDC